MCTPSGPDPAAPPVPRRSAAASPAPHSLGSKKAMWVSLAQGRLDSGLEHRRLCCAAGSVCRFLIFPILPRKETAPKARTPERLRLVSCGQAGPRPSGSVRRRCQFMRSSCRLCHCTAARSSSWLPARSPSPCLRALDTASLRLPASHCRAGVQRRVPTPLHRQQRHPAHRWCCQQAAARRL